MKRAPLALALALGMFLPAGVIGQRPTPKTIAKGRADVPPTAMAREHLKELLLEIQVAKALAGAVGDRASLSASN